MDLARTWKLPSYASPDPYKVFHSHKLSIIIAGVLGATLLLIAGELVPARYTANAQLLVDPRDLRLIGNEVTPQQLANESLAAIVDSQVQVLICDNVLGRVVERLALDHDQEFVGDPNSTIQFVRDLLWPTLQGNDLALLALARLQQQVSATRIARSLVIDLKVSTRDQEKSTRISSAIIEEYLQEQQKYRADASAEAARSIGSSLQALQDKVSESERKVEQFRAQAKLETTSGRLVTEQQLAEINSSLSKASAEVDLAKTRLEEINSASKIDSIPEAVLSQSLRGLRGQLAATAAHRAKVAVMLLPNHPAMAALNEQERELKGQIAAELMRIKESAKHDYDRARVTELRLAERLESLRNQLKTANSAQITMRELERDLDANRALYRQAMTRAREAREQVHLNTANIHIIDSPKPLLVRTFPPQRWVLLILGLVVGLGLSSYGFWRRASVGPDRRRPLEQT